MPDCLALITEASGGKLSDDELIDIIEDLQAERKAREAQSGLDDVESAIMDRGRVIAEEAKIAAMIEKRNRLQNIVVEQRLIDLINRADEMTGQPALGLQAAIVGVNAPFEGAGRSVDALTNANMNAYAGGLIVDMKRAGMLTQFNSMKGGFERDVAEALADLNSPEPKGVSVSKDAKAIAKIMHKYQRAAVERENRAGAYIRQKRGYVVRQSHDPSKLARLGRQAWKDNIRDRLDFGAMNVAPEKVDRFLDSAFDAIESGVRLDKEVSTIDRAFKGPGNLAKKESASRVLEFKSARDWYDYDQMFGRASLREAFMQDLSRSAKSTALMTNLGTNPQAMIDRVSALMEKKYRADPKKRAGFSGNISGVTIQNALDEVTGDVNIGSHTKVARVFSSYRGLQTMAKLGGAWISALSDVAFIATNRVYQGRSLMDAWGDAFSAVFEGMSGAEKREMADMIGVGLEGQLGDFMARFNAQDEVAGKTSKLMARFFKLNLLGPWTDANKRGVTFMIARDFAGQSDKAFDGLPDDFQRMLRVYGISAKDWDIARKAVRDGPDGGKYLMPGDIDDVRGAEFTGMSAAQQQKARDRVRESIFALYSSEADYSVPTPGARERAILRRGYRPGTVAGEAIRFVGQFKSFGVTALTKVAGRQAYGQGAATLREQLARGLGANVGMVNAIVGTTVLGYFVMQSKEIIKGREPRPANAKTFIAAMAQGGGLGIYGDFLFGEANRYGGGTLETVAGPGIGTAAEALDLLQRARGVVTGGDEDLRGDVLRQVKSNMPFANLFYAKQAMDYLVWYQLQETINPGYLRRMERRVERENNQKYWLPPSKVVATGGGLK